MHANPFDRYHHGHSWVHQLDPRAKVLITLAYILSCLLLPDGAWLGFTLAWAFALAVSQLAGISAAWLVKRSFIALPFALAALTVIFNLPGQPVLTVELGPLRLTATDAGLVRFASIVLRSWLSVHMAILMVTTTPFPDVIHALRHLHVPQILVAIVSFMYRYLFVLADETMRLLRARQSRSAALPDHKPGGSLAWRARVAGNMAGQLFLRSYERSDRVYNAMLARGYRGELMTMNPHQLQARDLLAGLIAAVALLLIQFLARVGA
jgi:cobalt/nickel transport system permease protein